MKGQRLGVVTPRIGADNRIRERWVSLIIYSMASGIVSFSAGAMASLLVPLPNRLAVWTATTFAISVTAGVIRDSQMFAMCCLWGRRLLHWIV